MALRIDELDPTTATRLAKLGVERSVRVGSWLFHDGELANRVFLITDGVFKIVKTDVTGRETLLRLAGPGTLTGEVSVLDNGARSAGVTAVTAGRVRTFLASDFLQLCRDESDLSLAIARMLSRRLRDLSDFVSASPGAQARVARRLLEIADAQVVGSVPLGVEFGLPLSQQELADWAGVSRAAVVKALRSFREDNIVSIERSRFTVYDLEGLQRAAR